MRKPAKLVLALVCLGIFVGIFCVLYFVVSNKPGFTDVPFLGNLRLGDGGVQEGGSNTAFSGFVEEEVGLQTEESAKAGPGEAMKHTFAFVSANRRSDPSLRPVLSEGEILIEVSEVNGAKVYKLIASKDSQFEGNVGEEVAFNPVISARDLIVQGRENSSVFYYSYELDGFTLPDSLEVGDKVVFKCRVSGCPDDSLVWALVFYTYE